MSLMVEVMPAKAGEQSKAKNQECIRLVHMNQRQEQHLLDLITVSGIHVLMLLLEPTSLRHA